jgi:hypothetical protein
LRNVTHAPRGVVDLNRGTKIDAMTAMASIRFGAELGESGAGEYVAYDVGPGSWGEGREAYTQKVS